jgi:predicted dehydrogenase
LAVVGAGHLGKFHARLLANAPDVELVGVVDPLPAQRENVAQECGTWPFADVREVVDRLDGAIVATPTKFHHQVCMDLLRRGIPVLVEKPMASTVSQCDDLVGVARRNRIALQVGHIERFNPAFVAAQSYLRDVKYIEATRAAGFTGRSMDIGVVLDLMIHDLDLVMALAGSPVRNVQALGMALVGRQEDVAQVRLEFENGCVANLQASRVSPTLNRRMQVWSATGFADIDFGNRTANVIRPSEQILKRAVDFEQLSSDERADFRDRLTTDLLPNFAIEVPAANAMQDEQRDFIDAVRQGRPPVVSGEHGREVVAVAEQIVAGIAEHRWHGRVDGPTGPLAVPGLPVLRGPHWLRQPAAHDAQRRAG